MLGEDNISGLRVTMIDNYDSFTYNLVQYLRELDLLVKVIRNDQACVDAVLEEKPDFLVISPGPSSPEQAGICLDLVGKALQSQTPLLGVCLGHQCIGQALGGRVIKAQQSMHGKVSRIFHSQRGVFKGLPNPLEATRYHSLIVQAHTLPACLEVSAHTEDGVIMGLKHKACLMEGVQFHPESVLTSHGKAMLARFAQQVASKKRRFSVTGAC